jgi:uncharacterized peroxidase-related enzyme
MPFIATADETASEEVAAIFDEERARLGYVPNYVRLFAARPAVYEAWKRLVVSVRESGDPRRYELVTLAAARRLRSSYCSLAHAGVLVERFYDAPTVRAIFQEPRSAGLDDADVALMELAEQVVDDATSVSQEDVDRLRDLGLTDDEILDAVLAAAVRCFFTKTLDAVGVLPDAELGERDPELREALLVGRPLDASRA